MTLGRHQREERDPYRNDVPAHAPLLGVGGKLKNQAKRSCDCEDRYEQNVSHAFPLALLINKPQRRLLPARSMTLGIGPRLDPCPHGTSTC